MDPRSGRDRTIDDRPVDLRALLVNELRVVAKRMNQEGDSAKRLFYFSAAYGAADRVLRLKYDRELLMIARVLQHTYDQFAARANGLASGESIISITPDMLRRLADLTGSLASRIECNEEIDPVLLEMVELAYRTTGAGYYMSVTGALD